METRAHYVAVGAFVLTVILLGFVAVLFLGRAEFSTQYSRYDIYFTGTVSGLGQGSPVLYNGIRAGRVSDIRIDPHNVELIRVEVEIENKVVIKADAVAGVETNLLSGVSTIQITGGTQNAPVLVAEAGQPYPVIQSRRSQLERVYARAPRLLERLIELTDNLNTLVDEPNRKAFSEILENLRVASGSLVNTTKRLDDVTGDAREALGQAKTTFSSIGKLADDLNQGFSGRDGLKKQLSGAITDYDQLAKGLNDTNKRLQGTLQDLSPGVKELSQRTVGQIGSLVTEARQLVSGLSRLASDIERDPTRFIFGDRREGYKPR